MIPFAKHLTEDRRLCVLRTLVDVNGTANDSVLQTSLEMLGHRHLSRDIVRADLTFLINAGLITDEWLEHIQICTITRRGVEVAEGRITVEGVKKPSLGR